MLDQSGGAVGGAVGGTEPPPAEGTSDTASARDSAGNTSVEQVKIHCFYFSGIDALREENNY